MRLIHKILQISFIFSFVLIAQLFNIEKVFADITSPVGVWQTIDDKTNKPRSIVQIWQQDNELRGKILKIYYQPGEGEKDVCKKCTGVNHNKPILGMTIIWGMSKQDDDWKGGKILDPKNGKTYSCKMTLIEGGQQLKVRGYIGTPLLGRTQIWIRQSNGIG